MLTETGGAVCPACTPYFREKKACGLCQKLTARLSRVPQFGVTELVCDSCRNKFTHETCSHCKRYRPRAANGQNGGPLCKPCSRVPGVTHPCPSCSEPVPGTGKGLCLSCLNFSRVQKEVTVHRLALTQAWSRALFERFADWFVTTKHGQTDLLRKFATHEYFFERLDAAFASVDEITTDRLLEAFSVAELRRYLLSREFLVSELGLTLSSETKQVHGERDTIQNKIVASKGESWGPLIAAYAAWLTEQAYSPRTARLYLRAAEKFCVHGAVQSDKAWKDSTLRRFLKQHASARASLYKFVTYCQKVRRWDVSMPPKNASTSTPRTVSRLRTLRRKISEDGLQSVETPILQKALAIAFGLPLDSMRAARWRSTGEKQSLLLVYNSEEIAVPTELVEIANELARRAKILEASAYS